MTRVDVPRRDAIGAQNLAMKWRNVKLKSTADSVANGVTQDPLNVIVRCIIWDLILVSTRRSNVYLVVN